MNLCIYRDIYIQQIKCEMDIRNHCVQSHSSQELSQEHKLEFLV